MTLVVATKLFEVPVLAGDFIVSSKGTTVPHMMVPTQPRLPSLMPAGAAWKISGLRKKISIVRPELALGWSGSTIGARTLIRELREYQPITPFTFASLSKFLSTLHDFGSNVVEVVGWVGSDAPTAFRWCSDCHRQIEAIGDVAIGSGASTWISAQPRAMSHFSATLVDPAERAISAMLAKAAILLGSEVHTGSTLKHFSGYGLELIYWAQGSFRYVDEVTYLMFDIEAVSPENFQGNIIPIIYKYKSFGQHCIVQVTQLNSAGRRGAKSGDTFVSVITPVDNSMPDLDLKKIEPLSLRSDYYCVFIRWRLLGRGEFSGPIVLAADGNDDAFSFNSAHGIEYISLKNAFVSSLIRNMSSYKPPFLR
ncbi:hypothetical protein [Dongia rigui]|uniref:Uncharacterized protein n=1 Tax=Dongia rigui TaxID=940149 RepID=A0ABU5E2R0_9PROT|nr:hypothetical protein [Dongia rigui]MDY0873183.1 hypothetical protein [Dongia rigui]